MGDGYTRSGRKANIYSGVVGIADGEVTVHMIPMPPHRFDPADNGWTCRFTYNVGGGAIGHCLAGPHDHTSHPTKNP